MTPFSVLFRYYFRRNHGPVVLGGLAVVSVLGLYFLIRHTGQNAWVFYLGWLACSLSIAIASTSWYAPRESDNFLLTLASRRQQNAAKLAVVAVLAAGFCVPAMIAGVNAVAAVWYWSVAISGFVVLLSVFSVLIASDRDLREFPRGVFRGTTCVTILLILLAATTDMFLLGALAALLPFLALAAFFLIWRDATETGEAPEAGDRNELHEEMALAGQDPGFAGEPGRAPLIVGQRLEMFPDVVTTARLDSDEESGAQEGDVATVREQAERAAAPAGRRPGTVSILISLTGAHWYWIASLLILQCVGYSGLGLVFAFSLVALWIAFRHSRGSITSFRSPIFLMAPTKQRLRIFHLVALPSVALALAFAATTVLSMPPHWLPYDVRASLTDDRGKEPAAAVIELGFNNDLRLVSGADESKELPVNPDFNEFVVQTELDDTYVARQMEALLWNEYGVRGVGPRRDRASIVTGEYSLSVPDAARVALAAHRVHVFPVVFGALVYLAFLWVTFTPGPSGEKSRITFARLRPTLSIAMVAVGLAVYFMYVFSHDELGRWAFGLSLTPSGDIARSSWGYVYAFVNAHWYPFLAASAALCALLYWRALRGFLMMDLAGSVSSRGIFGRKTKTGD